MNKKAAFWVITIPLSAMIASAFLLTAVFGPSDSGLRCSRDGVSRACEIRQTRFFGLIGNNSFSVPESHIREANARCVSRGVGGHGAPSCNVYLQLDDGEQYLVLSYALKSQAESSTERLNTYLRDDSARSIGINEDVLTPVLMFGVGPIVFVAVLFLCIRAWKSRRSAMPAPAAI